MGRAGEKLAAAFKPDAAAGAYLGPGAAGTGPDVAGTGAGRGGWPGGGGPARSPVVRQA
jgi:hypothetical protein